MDPLSNLQKTEQKAPENRPPDQNRMPPVPTSVSSSEPLDPSRVTAISTTTQKTQSGPPITPQTSIFTLITPALTQPEKKLLLEMFSRWALSRQLCLIDLLYLDITIHWDELVPLAQKSPELQQNLTRAKEGFVCQFFASFAYFIGKGTTDPTLLETLNCRRFFHTETITTTHLKETIQFVSALNLPSSNSSKSGKKIQEFLKKKQQEFIYKKKGLTDKLELLSKIYQSKDPCALLVSRNLSNYTESTPMDKEAPQKRPSCLLQFNRFIISVLKIGIQRGVLGVKTDIFDQFDRLIQQTISSPQQNHP